MVEVLLVVVVSSDTDLPFTAGRLATRPVLPAVGHVGHVLDTDFYRCWLKALVWLVPSRPSQCQDMGHDDDANDGDTESDDNDDNNDANDGESESE